MTERDKGFPASRFLVRQGSKGWMVTIGNVGGQRWLGSVWRSI
jgi:hypothetical protein